MTARRKDVENKRRERAVSVPERIASRKDKCMAPGDEFFNHPDVIAAIRKGEEDIKAGRMSVYDPETGETKPYKPS